LYLVKKGNKKEYAGMTLSDQINERMGVAHLFNVIKVWGNECGAVVGNDDGPKFQNLRQVTIDSLPEADRVFL
jgi:DNA gyrase subunit B